MKRVWTAFWIALATLPGLIVLATTTTTSQAQFKGSSRGGGQKDEAAAPKKKVDDSQYKAALERMPDKKFDPWQNMR
jgi:hypothetical protein